MPPDGWKPEYVTTSVSLKKNKDPVRFGVFTEILIPIIT